MIDSIIEQAYEALTFAPGSAPDWAAFDAVFDPRAVLALRVFPDDADVSVLDLRGYHAAQVTRGIAEQGYSETPGARAVVTAGDVALVRQDFTMNFADRDPVAAVDIFMLARSEDRWRIFSVASDTEGHGAADQEPAILSTLERALRAHAFNPGGDHDWETLDAAFVPRALMGVRFFPDNPDALVIDVREFMDHPRRDSALRVGLEEVDRERTIEVVGDVAYVHEDFTMRFAHHEPVGAIDIFTLVRDGGAWRIVSFITDFKEHNV